MTSNISDHTAKRLARGDDRWLVSWLHDRQVSRDQAISAMTIAGIVATEKNPERDHRLWSFIDNLACELGMRASDAIVQASTDPTAERSEADINEVGDPDQVLTSEPFDESDQLPMFPSLRAGHAFDVQPQESNSGRER